MAKQTRFESLLPLFLLFSLFAIGSAVTMAMGPSESSEPLGLSVRDFGAVGDGSNLDTKAIQGAIDEAATTGGSVLLPPGRYLCGTLFLRSNVSLHLSAGAVLLGSPNIEDYPETIPSLRSYTDNYVRKSLLYGENLTNVALEGRGMIDGQGAAFRFEHFHQGRRCADFHATGRPRTFFHQEWKAPSRREVS